MQRLNKRLVLEQGERVGCKSLSQELIAGKQVDGASAGRAVWINSYQRSWTAGWHSWSSESALSGRLPLGWTGSDPALLGHLPRNKGHSAYTVSKPAHWTAGRQGKGKPAGRALLYRLAQSLEGAGEQLSEAQ